jgi:hypothetical protein
VAKKELHEAEQFLELLEQAFQHDLEQLERWGTVDGRPMFFQELSPEQEMVMYSNPATKVRLLEGVLQQHGAEAVAKKREEMDERMAQYRAQMGVQNG